MLTGCFLTHWTALSQKGQELGHPKHFLLWWKELRAKRTSLFFCLSLSWCSKGFAGRHPVKNKRGFASCSDAALMSTKWTRVGGCVPWHYCPSLHSWVHGTVLALDVCFCGWLSESVFVRQVLTVCVLILIRVLYFINVFFWVWLTQEERGLERLEKKMS